MKVKTSKGFTLAELLIVMAIVVVLASVAIPSFTRQLETSRETADVETLRSAYTDAYTVALADASDDGLLNASAAGATGTGANPLAASTTAESVTTYTVTVSGLTFVQTKAGFDYISGKVGGVELSAVTGVTSDKLGTSDKRVQFTFSIDSNGVIVCSAIAGLAAA